MLERHLKTVELYFHVVLFIVLCKVCDYSNGSSCCFLLTTLRSVQGETLVCDLSNQVLKFVVRNVMK